MATITGNMNDILEDTDIDHVFCQVVKSFPFPCDLSVKVTRNGIDIHTATKEGIQGRYWSVPNVHPMPRKLVEAMAMEMCWKLLRAHYEQKMPWYKYDAVAINY